jgi:cobalt-precorrin-5B (C1)-methyltransferase
VGGWAINPVPRIMILEVVKEIFAMRCLPNTLTVTVSIPNGEELAKKTLNERLGVVGGLSILGTTGIVNPISASAWTDTIDSAIGVALACGSETVALSTGRTSELAAQKHLASGKRGTAADRNLKEEAFVLMGDHVGHALRACAAKGDRLRPRANPCILVGAGPA